MRHRAFRDTWLRRIRYAAIKVVLTDKPGDAAAILADEHEFDGIAAVGGDGTVFEILPALNPNHQCLTVLPAGRGNSLARALGFGAMPQALSALRHGIELPMDLMLLKAVHADGRTTRAVCASTIAVGYVAAVVARARNFAGGGHHGYTLAGLLTGPCFSEIGLGYDNEASQTKALTGLVISNVDHVAQYRAFPRARLDDGCLHAMELDASRFRQLRNNISMLAGLYPAVSIRAGKRVRVKLEAPEWLLADGEILEAVREFSVDCVAGAMICNRAADT